VQVLENDNRMLDTLLKLSMFLVYISEQKKEGCIYVHTSFQSYVILIREEPNPIFVPLNERETAKESGKSDLKRKLVQKYRRVHNSTGVWLWKG